MKFLLDTNICIYLINNKPTTVKKHFERCSPGDIGISSITLAELRYGVAKSKYIEKNQDALEKFLLPLEVVAFTDQTAFMYGKLRAELASKGISRGSLDLLIAAHALSLGVTLVTNDRKGFQGVKQVKVEQWR